MGAAHCPSVITPYACWIRGASQRQGIIDSLRYPAIRIYYLDKFNVHPGIRILFARNYGILFSQRLEPINKRGLFMRCRILSLIFGASLVLAGCSSIPSEAPELSAQLGTRISSLESTHVWLLEEFFRDKRQKVDDFIQEIWVPEFTQEFFSTPKIDAMWQQVAKSQDINDRVKFSTIVGQKLQEKINIKRTELIKPLDELELTIKNKLKSEYDQTRAINNTLTAFLLSASEVEANRKRYLDMVGITDSKVDNVVNETDQAVSELVDAAQSIADKAKNAEKYRDKIKDILDKLRK